MLASIGVLMLGLGCGASQDDLDALTEQLTAEQAKSADIETRLSELENRTKGIGYVGLRMRWDPGKWADPEIRCRGPESSPRDFAQMPAAICVHSGWRRSRRPEQMRVQARNKGGEVVFNQKVDYSAEDMAYCFELSGYACETIHSLGVGSSPPALNAI